jgi:hypothetical protein
LESRWCRRELNTLSWRSKQEGDYKLIPIFEREGLIYLPEYRDLKKIGAIIRGHGLSDRQHLIRIIVPEFLRLAKRSECSTEVLAKLLDEYIADQSETVPHSLCRQY